MKTNSDQPKLALTQAEQSHVYKLDYDLRYGEAYEAFYLLTDKWGKKWRLAAFAAMGVAAVVCLVLAILDPYSIQNSMLIVLCAAMMLFVMYWPSLKAQKGAKAVVKAGGHCRYQLNARKGFRLESGHLVGLQGDPDARAIESAASFIVRPDRQNTFCIPKRVLTPEDILGIRRLLYSGIKKTRLSGPVEQLQAAPAA
jgi:hypothetical protein